MAIKEIALTGHTNASPYEVFFRANGVSYTYGASYDVCQKCLWIDEKCGHSGGKALNYIKRRADYCLKFKGGRYEHNERCYV